MFRNRIIQKHPALVGIGRGEIFGKYFKKKRAKKLRRKK